MNNDQIQEAEVIETSVVPFLEPHLLTVAKESGLELPEAQGIGSKFAPFMQKVNEISELVNGLVGKEITPELAKKAREYRLELVSSRGKNGLLATEEELKRSLLIRTKLIQSYKGVVLGHSQITEDIAEGIEKHSERVEADRVNKVYNERVSKLEPFGEVNKFIDLRGMDDVTFDNFLADTKLAYETRRENERLAELKRIEDEKKAEEERIEAEKKAEEARLKKEAEDKAERERIEKENAALKKQQEQREEAEKQRIIKELAKVEKFSKMLVDGGFELSNSDSYISNDQHIWCKDEYTVSFGQLTLIESVDELKELIDNIDARIVERKRLEKLQADKDSEISKYKKELEEAKLQKEKELSEEKARIEAEEAEKLAKEKADLLAPDKEKINALYVQIRDFQFPEVKTDEANKIISYIKESFAFLLTAIKDQAKSLK